MPVRTSTAMREPRRRFTLFDYLVIAGGLINLTVVSYIIGYWFLH